MGVSFTPCTGTRMFPVHTLHRDVCSRCSGSALCRGQQCDVAPASAVEAGGGPVHSTVSHQQSGQYPHVCGVPTSHTVLPHLVHHSQLLPAGPS